MVLQQQQAASALALQGKEDALAERDRLLVDCTRQLEKSKEQVAGLLEQQSAVQEKLTAAEAQRSLLQEQLADSNTQRQDADAAQQEQLQSSAPREQVDALTAELEAAKKTDAEQQAKVEALQEKLAKVREELVCIFCTMTIS